MASPEVSKGSAGPPCLEWCCQPEDDSHENPSNLQQRRRVIQGSKVQVRIENCSGWTVRTWMKADSNGVFWDLTPRRSIAPTCGQHLSLSLHTSKMHEERKDFQTRHRRQTAESLLQETFGTGVERWAKGTAFANECLGVYGSIAIGFGICNQEGLTRSIEDILKV